jgi:hypothetical protein
MLEYTFTIKKAIINLNSIERDGDREYIYNGDNQSPSIKNGTIPNHVSVTEQLFSIDANGNRTAVDSAVNVGNYVKVVTVTLDDPTRYQLSNSGVIEWAFEIKPQPIDVEIDSLTFEYDGTPHQPMFVDLPTYVQITQQNVYLINSATGEESLIDEAINAGTYCIKLTFVVSDKNYTLSDSTDYCIEFAINKKVIDIADWNFGTADQPIKHSYSGFALKYKYFESLSNEDIGKYLSCYVDPNHLSRYENGEWLSMDGDEALREGRYMPTYQLTVKDSCIDNVTLVKDGKEYVALNVLHYFNITLT